jgi:nucleotide-binding universal stress UspA family protein
VAIRDILFHLEAESSAKSAADFATSLAAKTGARLTAGGIVIEYPPPAIHPSIGMMGFSGLATIEQMVEERRAALEQSYLKLKESLPATVQSELAIIHGYRGIASHGFARLARYFDLSVVGQRAPGAEHLDELVAAATLIGSGRPVFVIPFIHKGPAKLDKAMICWDGGTQAARAVSASMALIAHAKSVEVVRIGAKGESDKIPGVNIANHLARHGVAARMTELPAADRIGEAILSYAADISADYIVMGAYGHWRLTEIVLGGTTREILVSMTTPVLMAH